MRPLELRAIWSPDRKLIATEPIRIVVCPKGTKPGLVCTREGSIVYVARADGSARRKVWRGHLLGWAPDGRLLVTDDRYARYTALDLRTGSRELVLPPEAVIRFAGVRGAISGRPVWSADRRYVAADAGFFWPRKERARKVNAFLIARADGRIVRLITSRYIISMLAWSPRGHRLAYTTSGFPNPHELFVLDEPAGNPRKVFGTSNRHFDWVTWSPDGRYLLVDDANFGFDPERPGRRPPGRWVLFEVSSGKIARLHPRLGGRPIWCCPEGAYVTKSG